MDKDKLTEEYWKRRLEMADSEEEIEMCRQQMCAMIIKEVEFDERKREKEFQDVLKKHGYKL